MDVLAQIVQLLGGVLESTHVVVVDLGQGIRHPIVEHDPTVLNVQESHERVYRQSVTHQLVHCAHTMLPRPSTSSGQQLREQRIVRRDTTQLCVHSIAPQPAVEEVDEAQQETRTHPDRDAGRRSRLLILIPSNRSHTLVATVMQSHTAQNLEVHPRTRSSRLTIPSLATAIPSLATAIPSLATAIPSLAAAQNEFHLQIESRVKDAAFGFVVICPVGLEIGRILVVCLFALILFILALGKARIHKVLNVDRARAVTVVDAADGVIEAGIVSQPSGQEASSQLGLGVNVPQTRNVDGSGRRQGCKLFVGECVLEQSVGLHRCQCSRSDPLQQIAGVQQTFVCHRHRHRIHYTHQAHAQRPVCSHSSSASFACSGYAPASGYASSSACSSSRSSSGYACSGYACSSSGHACSGYAPASACSSSRSTTRSASSSLTPEMTLDEPDHFASRGRQLGARELSAAGEAVVVAAFRAVDVRAAFGEDVVGLARRAARIQTVGNHTVQRLQGLGSSAAHRHAVIHLEDARLRIQHYLDLPPPRVIHVHHPQTTHALALAAHLAPRHFQTARGERHAVVEHCRGTGRVVDDGQRLLQIHQHRFEEKSRVAFGRVRGGV